MTYFYFDAGFIIKNMKLACKITPYIGTFCSNNYMFTPWF